MLLVSELLNIQSSLAFELIMHLATLLAVIVYYRKSLIQRLKKPFAKDNWYLISASAITAVIAGLIRFTIGDMQSTAYLPLFFMLTAALLILGKAFTRKGQMNFKKSSLIGLAQGLAVIPGLSRSGTTISVALCLGVDKEEATEFSFLLSIPIIIGSSIVELITTPLSGINLFPLIIGLITAFITGMLSLAIIGKIMKKASLDIFSVYLIILAIVLLIIKI